MLEEDISYVTMPDRLTTDSFTELPPEEVFIHLSNETRIQILRALWAAMPSSLTFSQLREHIGNPDSGHFNYHLNQLTGTFVRIEDETYILSYAGGRIIGAIFAGTYTTYGSLSPVELSSHESLCCAAPLFLEYTNESVTIRCSNCDRMLSHAGFPAGVLQHHSMETFPRMFNRWLIQQVMLMKAGICPNCDGRMDTSIVKNTSSLDTSAPAAIKYECKQCHHTAFSPFGTYLIDHPAVVSFYYEHGMDVKDEVIWETPWIGDERTRIISGDPLRIEVTVSIDDDEIVLVLNEELSVNLG